MKTRGKLIIMLLVFVTGIVVVRSIYTNPNTPKYKLVDLVKKVKPSVVLIETFDKDNEPIGRGSGFFIDNKGSLITNHHVIEDAYSATIKTSAGKEYPVQGIIAKNTEADIVKLVVNLPDADMTFLNLSVNVPSEGEDIFVIGNPLGLESTVSSGIVSAVRDIPTFGKIIQITAPVSHGSSGSPVINSKGEVIGIATLCVTEGQNLNFAIPSDRIIALKETTKVTLSEAYASLTAAPNNESGNITELPQKPQEGEFTRPKPAPVPKGDFVKRPDGGYNERWTDKTGQSHWYRQEDTTGTYAREYREYTEQKAHCNRGIAYGKLGRYQEAIDAFKQAIRIKPDFAEAHYNLGIAYGNLGRHQEAIEAFKQAIRIKPDFAEAHCNLGLAYGKLGRYQEAIEAFKQAIRIKPDFAEAHYNLGIAYSYSRLGKNDDYKDAIEAFKQAIKIKPDYADAHLLLGSTYLSISDKDSALEEYKILKTLDAGKANDLLNWINDKVEQSKTAANIVPDSATPEKIVVKGIIYLPKGSSSILTNGKIVYEGQYIGEVKVVKITPDGVWFEKNGTMWETRMARKPNP